MKKIGGNTAQMPLGYPKRHTNLDFGSQAVLLAMVQPQILSGLFWDCVKTFNALSQTNYIQLFLSVWSPKGNEITDRLAKAGSTSNLIGPELSLLLPNGTMSVFPQLRQTAPNRQCYANAYFL